MRYVDLPRGGGTAALVTMDNGLDHTKPTTFGPQGLANIDAALDEVARPRRRRRRVAVTGKPFIFAVGADLKVMQAGGTVRAGPRLFGLGHQRVRQAAERPVPSFAFVNGAAMGGGLEIALHCHYRTISSGVPALRCRSVPRAGPRLGRHPPAAEPDRAGQAP